MFSAAILFVKGLGSILDERLFITGYHLNMEWFREQEEAAYLVY